MSKNQTWHARWIDTFARATLKFRWLSLFCLILFTVFFMKQSQGLEFDGAFESWFVDGDPVTARLDKFKQNFGNKHFVYILIETDDFFKPGILDQADRLARDLEKGVPYLRDATWVGNAEYIQQAGDGIEIVELFENIPADPKELETRKRKALSDPDFLDRYISQDGKTGAILLEMSPYPQDRTAPASEVAKTVFDIVNLPAYKNLDTYIVGDPVFEYSYNKIAEKETPMFLLICLLVQIVLLASMSRSVKGVIVPLGVVFIGIVWTFGAIKIIGYDLNLMVMGLPVLLLCVGIADAMHLVAAFNNYMGEGENKRDAIVKSMKRLALPCVFTTLTTAAGFLSFATAPIAPFREMAVCMGVGVVFVLLITFLTFPFFYSFGKDFSKKKKDREQRNDLFDRVLNWIYRTNVRHPKKILSVFLVLFVLFAAGTPLLRIETNTSKLLTERSPVRRAIDNVDAKMGGSMALEIMVDTQKENGTQNLEFLRKLDELETYAKGHPLAMDTFSILDLLKKMRQALHRGDISYYALPESDAALAEYLLTYEISGGNQMDKVLSFDSSMVRLNIRTRSMDTLDARRIISDMEEKAKRIFDDSAKVEITGSIELSAALTDNMAECQKVGFISAFCVIALLLSLVLRSFKLGLISMIPNIFPAVSVLGLMGFTGLYMDPIIMSISAIIIGVGVDDTVHFFVRFRREFDLSGDYEIALGKTLREAGRPILFTTIILVLGFSCFMFSVMNGWIRFGLLSGFAFSLTFLADVFVSPAIFLLFKPLGAKITPSEESSLVSRKPEEKSYA